jgi:rhamnopyranosyl-N-acetylglucosaminyl-diphospho-decaprenol beta-1,3/1,4-galactofuranosyltransferase
VKVLAVVVTFNRQKLLARCIENIQNQSRPPDEILVINNSSTDSTEEFLTKEKINFITQPNLGSAGGWHRGLSYAQINNFDTCWLMDDDGYPDKFSLEKLCKEFSTTTSCLSSIVVEEEQTDRFVFPMPKLNNKNLPVLTSFQRKFTSIHSKSLSNQAQYPFVHLFNGALISILATKKIGNVETDFFMMGDEVDYFFKLRSVGEVASLMDAKHYHPAVRKRPYSNIKVYYLIKNTIILHNRYFDKPFLRNFGLIIVTFFRVLKRNGLIFTAIFFLSFKNNFFIKALIGGLKNKVGQDH